MTLPTSLLAFEDCTELFNKALESSKGIRYRVADYDAAIHLRHRLHYCRKLHRDRNQEIYPPDNIEYGRSHYDRIICRIKRHADEFYIYLERSDFLQGEVEDLDGLVALPPPSEPVVDFIEIIPVKPKQIVDMNKVVKQIEFKRRV